MRTDVTDMTDDMTRDDVLERVISEHALDEDMYMLTCEMTNFALVRAGKDEVIRPCGKPAVNGFLCMEHTDLARANGVEDALSLVYGCAPCDKVITRGFSADGREFRKIHFDADLGRIEEELVEAYRDFLLTAKLRGVEIVRGPYVMWQSAYRLDNTEEG